MPAAEGKTPSITPLFNTPISFDPIRMRLDQAAERIRRKRHLGILQDYIRATDLNQQLDLALLMDVRLGRLAIISLSKEHPENKELQVVAFLVRYYGGPDDKLSRRGPDYTQDFATAQADEPENGYLLLLGVDETFEKEKVPLTPAEIDLLKRAVHSKAFDTHFGCRDREAAAESRARGGECLELPSQGRLHPHPCSIRAVGHIVRRAGLTIVGFFKAGKEAEAQALLSDVELLIATVRSEHSDSALRSLNAHSMAASLSRKLAEYAAPAKRADLLEKVIPEWEAAVRFEAIAGAGAGAGNKWTLLELPVRRIRYSDSSDQSILLENSGLRTLRLYPDRFRDEAFENLRYVNDKGQTSFLLEYNAIVILQMLKDPKALPILEPIVGHADPLLSRLAREAVAAIKSNP
jgi:hypothetical protein